MKAARETEPGEIKFLSSSLIILTASTLAPHRPFLGLFWLACRSLNPLKTACKTLSLQYFTSADRISMRVLKFAKFIPERRHNSYNHSNFQLDRKR